MSATRSSSKSAGAERVGAWFGGIVVFGLAFELTAIGCYDPTILDGRLPCTNDNAECPSGFYCETSCGHCYHETLAGHDLAQTCTVVDIHGSVDGGTGGGSGEGTGGGGRYTGTGGGTVMGGGGSFGTGGVSGGGGARVGSGGYGGTIVGGSGGTPGGIGGMNGAAGAMGTAGHVGTGGTSGGAGRTGSGGAMMGTGGTMGVGGKTGIGGAMMGVGGAMMGMGGAPGFGNGSACSMGTQCASGFCVDGFCCNVACTDQCQACDVAPGRGTCSPVASGPPHGARAACAGSGTTCGAQCKLITPSAAACVFAASTVSCAPQTCTGSTLTPARVCDGIGACAPATPGACPAGLSCNPGQTACLPSCTTSADCTPAAPNCNPGTHQCTTSHAIGASCKVAADCQNSQCIDGFCCDQLCSGSCQACDNAGQEGHCSLVAPGQPHGLRAACGAAGSTCGARCDGTDAQCQFPINNSCNCPGLGGLGLVGGMCDGMGNCSTIAGLCIL